MDVNGMRELGGCGGGEGHGCVYGGVIRRRRDQGRMVESFSEEKIK
jgi:hypothetical protein